MSENRGGPGKHPTKMIISVGVSKGFPLFPLEDDSRPADFPDGFPREVDE